MQAKTAGISKLMDKMAVPSFKPRKSHLSRNFFFYYIQSLIHFWSIEIVLSGINSGTENKFESLGSQKVDFHVMGK